MSLGFHYWAGDRPLEVILLYVVMETLQGEDCVGGRYCCRHFWNIIFHNFIPSVDLDIFLSSDSQPLSPLGGTYWVRRYPLPTL